MRNKYGFLGDCIEEWVPDRQASVLVLGAGRIDRKVLATRGYANVTVSDLSPRGEAAHNAGLSPEAASMRQAGA